MTDNLHEDLTDSILKKFFEDNDDVEMNIEVTWQTDLGFRVLIYSGGDSMARAGHPTSLNQAMLKLIPRTEEKIAEFRADQARSENAVMADDDVDED